MPSIVFLFIWIRKLWACRPSGPLWRVLTAPNGFALRADHVAAPVMHGPNNRFSGMGDVGFGGAYDRGETRVVGGIEQPLAKNCIKKVRGHVAT